MEKKAHNPAAYYTVKSPQNEGYGSLSVSSLITAPQG